MYIIFTYRHRSRKSITTIVFRTKYDFNVLTARTFSIEMYKINICLKFSLKIFSSLNITRVPDKRGKIVFCWEIAER